MVYELKPPVENSPGLLCFTHKERPYFCDSGSELHQKIKQLKKEYLLCMQWGSYHTDIGETPHIDFHLACPGTINWKPEANIRHIPMCSRDFTPDYFRPMDIPVRWDILAVGHPIKVKRMSELLDVIRMCFDEGVKLDVLLVCAMANDPEKLGPKWDHAFFRKYHEQFSDSERDHIDLAAFSEVEIGNRPIHPIPNKLFPYLYNAAASFTLFSHQEGQSKVIHEALLTGTPVIVHEQLKGGGRAYLDESNSIQFSNLDEAKDSFIKVAKDPDNYRFDPSDLRSKLVESKSAPKLESKIATIYDELGHPYLGEIDKDDLAFKLGGHTLTLRPELRRSNTNDLRSRYAFLLYINEKLEEETKFNQRLSAHYTDVANFDYISRIGRVIRRADTKVSFPLYDWMRKIYHYK